AGCWRAARVRASRSKRASRSGSFAKPSGSALIATVRSSRVSRARYTSPIPPAPSGARISNAPMREPAGSDMRFVRWKEGRKGGRAGATWPANLSEAVAERHHLHHARPTILAEAHEVDARRHLAGEDHAMAAGAHRSHLARRDSPAGQVHQ